MSNIPIERVLAGLLDVTGYEPRRRGREWSAKCPAHEDTTPSLSVGVGEDGRVLLCCHAGCTAADVCRAIGLTEKDLFPAKRGSRRRRAKRRIVATYDYREPEGALLFQVVRDRPKRFWQRRPDGKGGWHHDLGGVKRVLYRLPELQAADRNEWVYVCEGEKDADHLKDIGLVATTSPGGAGKWRPKYGESLRGRRVAILPDNDLAGHNHGEAVARALHEAAADVRIVHLPDLSQKGDVTDWLEAGGTSEALIDLVEATGAYVPPAQDDSARPRGEKTDCSYRATSDGLVWLKPTREGSVDVPLTNFTARIIGDIVRDDGVEHSLTFEIEATQNNRTMTFQVPARRFDSMSWATQHLGASAAVLPGFGLKDRARFAIQILSGPTIERRHVFLCTGWRDIGGVPVFVHGGGGIGPDGPVPGIEVDLPPSLARFELPAPATGEALRKAIRTTLGLLDIGPDTVTVPLVCAVWRAVHGPADFSLHIAGPTGAGKTVLAALIQQHFGAELGERNLPASWTSTANSLEELAFLAKDALMVVDDFAPGGTALDRARLHGQADRLLRSQGNRSGRARMARDASLRAGRPPRGLLVSTGEDVPLGQSLRARVLVLELGPTDLDWQAVTQCQHEAERGTYAATMAAFLRWLASRRGGEGKEAKCLRNEVRQLRSEIRHSGSHRRTAEIIAHLGVGWRRFLAFAEAVGAVSSSEHGRLWERAWKALGAVAEAQAAFLRSADPVERFRELLVSAFQAGAGHVAARSGGPPAEEYESPGRWGWRRDFRDLSDSRWQPMGDRIGSLVADEVYLDPDASYRVANRMASDGSGIPVAALTLRKRLHEAGVLQRRERGKLTTYRVVDGVRQRVLVLPKAWLTALMSNIPGHSGISGSDPPGRSEEVGSASKSVPGLACGGGQRTGDRS